MLRAVVFDLDDTLVDLHGAKTAACEYASINFGLDVPKFITLETELWNQFALGKLSAKELHRVRWEAMGLSVKQSELLEPEFERIIDSTLPCPGAFEVIGHLHSLGLKVGVLSNGTAIPQRAKIDRIGLLSKLDFILTSEEVGVGKPNPRAFEAFCSGIGLPPKDCAMVGDNPVGDILGALKSGFAQALWLPGPAIAPHRVEELAHLHNLSFNQIVRHLEEVPSSLDLGLLQSRAGI